MLHRSNDLLHPSRKAGGRGGPAALHPPAATPMNAQHPRPRFRPSSPPLRRAPGECTPTTTNRIDLPPTILDELRADEVAAFRVEAATIESVAMPIGRNPAAEAIAYHQTASRALRQGALKDDAAARRAW